MYVCVPSVIYIHVLSSPSSDPFHCFASLIQPKTCDVGHVCPSPFFECVLFCILLKYQCQPFFSLCHCLHPNTQAQSSLNGQWNVIDVPRKWSSRCFLQQFFQFQEQNVPFFLSCHGRQIQTFFWNNFWIETTTGTTGFMASKK